MASELKVDKFTGVTTAGSILVTGEGGSNTTNLQQGLAKAWASYVQSTPSVLDSLNTSSITDSSAGDYEHNFSSNMSDANYATVAAMRHIGGTGFNAAITVGYGTRASNTIGVVTANGSDSLADAAYSCTSVLGDLA